MLLELQADRLHRESLPPEEHPNHRYHKRKATEGSRDKVPSPAQKPGEPSSDGVWTEVTRKKKKGTPPPEKPEVPPKSPPPKSPPVPTRKPSQPKEPSSPVSKDTTRKLNKQKTPIKDSSSETPMETSHNLKRRRNCAEGKMPLTSSPNKINFPIKNNHNSSKNNPNNFSTSKKSTHNKLIKLALLTLHLRLCVPPIGHTGCEDGG